MRRTSLWLCHFLDRIANFKIHYIIEYSILAAISRFNVCQISQLYSRIVLGYISACYGIKVIYYKIIQWLIKGGYKSHLNCRLAIHTVQVVGKRILSRIVQFASEFQVILVVDNLSKGCAAKLQWKARR